MIWPTKKRHLRKIKWDIVSGTPESMLVWDHQHLTPSLIDSWEGLWEKKDCFPSKSQYQGGSVREGLSPSVVHRTWMATV